MLEKILLKPNALNPVHECKSDELANKDDSIFVKELIGTVKNGECNTAVDDLRMFLNTS